MDFTFVQSTLSMQTAYHRPLNIAVGLKLRIWGEQSAQLTFPFISLQCSIIAACLLRSTREQRIDLTGTEVNSASSRQHSNVEHALDKLSARADFDFGFTSPQHPLNLLRLPFYKKDCVLLTASVPRIQFPFRSPPVSPKPLKMPIRPAVYSDLLPASKFLARAFQDEDLFGIYMHPKRNQYPDDMYLHFLNKLRIGWASGPSNHFLVSYKTDSTGQEILTGIARWQRLSAANGTPSLYTKTSLNAMKAYIYLESFLYPNRAVDPSRTGILGPVGPFIGHFWTGSRSEVWDLDFLGVDPDHGRQGFGRELVAWGFEQARRDGVGCSVIASDGKERFYQSCGFDKVVGTVRDFGGERNPMVTEGIKGGTILFWDAGRDLSGVKEYGEK